MKNLILIAALLFLECCAAQGPRKCGNLTTTPASSPNTTQSTGNSSKNLFQLSKQRIPRNPCQLCLIISAELSKDPTIKTKVCQNCNILLSFSDSCEKMINDVVASGGKFQDHCYKLCGINQEKPGKKKLIPLHKS